MLSIFGSGLKVEFGLKFGTGFKVRAAHSHKKIWELTPVRICVTTICVTLRCSTAELECGLTSKILTQFSCSRCRPRGQH